MSEKGSTNKFSKLDLDDFFGDLEPPLTDAPTSESSSTESEKCSAIEPPFEAAALPEEKGLLAPFLETDEKPAVSTDTSDNQCAMIDQEDVPTQRPSRAGARPLRAAAAVAAAAISSPAPSQKSSSNSKANSTHSKKSLELWNTTVRYVPSRELVWAPHYSFGDCLFPARIAKENETSSCKQIKWPIPSHEFVVEMLSAPKSSDNPYLVVEKKYVIPYFANKRTGGAADAYAEEAKKSWNESQMKSVETQLKKVALKKKLSKSDVEFIYTSIKNSAEQFLQLSLNPASAAATLSPAIILARANGSSSSSSDSSSDSKAIDGSNDESRKSPAAALSQLTASSAGSLHVNAASPEEATDSPHKPTSTSSFSTASAAVVPQQPDVDQQAPLLLRPGMLVILTDLMNNNLMYEPQFEVVECRIGSGKIADSIKLSSGKVLFKDSGWQAQSLAIVQRDATASNRYAIRMLTRALSLKKFELSLEPYNAETEDEAVAPTAVNQAATAAAVAVTDMESVAATDNDAVGGKQKENESAINSQQLNEGKNKMATKRKLNIADDPIVHQPAAARNQRSTDRSCSSSNGSNSYAAAGEGVAHKTRKISSH